MKAWFIGDVDVTVCFIDYDKIHSFSLVNLLLEKVMTEVTRKCLDWGCVRSFYDLPKQQQQTNEERDKRVDFENISV